MDTFNICGHRVARGEKKQVILEPNVAGYEMPATIVCGQQEGLTMVVSAGIHSGEYPGVAAVIRVAKEIDPSLVKGQILFVHCVNTSGFWAKSPSVVPEDGANLNGNYPGKAGGTTGERIADYFVKEIFPYTDFLVDLHSGSEMEPLTDCLFFPATAGEKVRTVSQAAAMVTGIPYLIASTAKTGEYSYAASLGIPGLLLERGHSGACKAEWVDGYCKDLYQLMEHFELVAPIENHSVCAKKVFEKTLYISAKEQGLWYPQVQENTTVKKGQVLGYMEDFFGNRIGEYLAEDDGVVFYYTSGLAANKGDHLIAYGLEAFATTFDV